MQLLAAARSFLANGQPVCVCLHLAAFWPPFRPATKSNLAPSLGQLSSPTTGPGELLLWRQLCATTSGTKVIAYMISRARRGAPRVGQTRWPVGPKRAASSLACSFVGLQWCKLGLGRRPFGARFVAVLRRQCIGANCRPQLHTGGPNDRRAMIDAAARA